MSSRKSRVQGGWSKGLPQTKKSFSAGTKPNNSVSNAASVQYIPNIQGAQKKPEDILISDNGEHSMSSGPSGISNLHRDFLDESEADHVFGVLHNELPWETAEDDRYGPQPRLTLWYGDKSYAYSGVVHPAKTNWHAMLLRLKDQLKLLLGVEFNSVACILYRDGHDSIGWHSDDEPILGPQPFIASLSFGDRRIFELRKKCDSTNTNEELCQVVRLHVTHGCLLTMEGHTQTDWVHRVPKEYHDRTPRINLTFRNIVQT